MTLATFRAASDGFAQYMVTVARKLPDSGAIRAIERGERWYAAGGQPARQLNATLAGLNLVPTPPIEFDGLAQVVEGHGFGTREPGGIRFWTVDGQELVRCPVWFRPGLEGARRLEIDIGLGFGGSLAAVDDIVSILRERVAAGLEVQTVIGTAISAHAVLGILVPGRRLIRSTGRLVLHEPASTVVFGSATELRELADSLDRTTGRIIDALVARTGLGRDQVSDWFRPGKDCVVGAAAAVELGLADEILDTDPSGG